MPLVESWASDPCYSRPLAGAERNGRPVYLPTSKRRRSRRPPTSAPQYFTLPPARSRARPALDCVIYRVALRDEPLPLFAAASAREADTLAEADEPAVALRPMTAGGEVVEDYRHFGLSLREHPIAFLRSDLRARRIVSCRGASESRDGRWLQTAGIVLVRQMPGSAKGVLFVTLEDETGVDLAQALSAPAPGDPRRPHVRRLGPCPARGRGGAPGRKPAHGPFKAARRHLRARGGVSSARWARRRGSRWRSRTRPA